MATEAPSVRENLERLLGTVRRSVRFLWVGGLVAVLGLAATLAFSLTRKHTYKSETVILYREIIPKSMIRDSGSSGRNRSLSIRFREMLFARPLLQKAVAENELYPEMVAAGDLDEAVETLRENIVFKERGGNTFRIAYRGRTREEAQRVTESLAKLLLAWEEDIQLEAATVTRKFFATQRERADLELVGAEYELARFVSQHPEFALDNKTPGASNVGVSIRFKEEADRNRPTPQPVGPRYIITPEQRALERQRDRINQRLGQLARVTPNRTPRPSPELERARREYERERDKLEGLKNQFTDKHPDVIRAKARAANAKTKLDRLAAAQPAPAPVSNDPKEREKLQAELATIEKSIAALKRNAKQVAAPTPKPKNPKAGDADQIVELEAEYARLIRKVGELRERYSSIEAKSYNSEIAAASEIARQGTQLTIIDPAYVPMRPAGAPIKLLFILGAMASLGLAGLVVLALGSLDDRIFSRTDLEQLDIGPIGLVIPALGKSRKPRKRRSG